MKFRDNPEKANKRLIALIEEMSGKSDRAVAIVGAAWVEEALTDSITSFLQDHDESRNRLFRGNAPLATFSSKIDHKTDNTRLTFSADHIRDKCLTLRSVEHEKHTDPRVAFTRACATLNADLDLFTLNGDKISDARGVVAKGRTDA